MAIDFPRSTYTAAEGVSAEGWPASPSNGDTQTNGAGDNFTFNGTSSLWVLDTGRTLTLSGGATYSWDGEKWIAQSHIPFRYFGPQSTDPTGLTADNEGDLYFNTVENEMRVYNGSSWDTITSVGNFNILTLSASSTAAPVGGTASFDGTATRFQLSETPNVAQQLLISINGVVQEPQAGTSPTDGFAVDGNDIIFASAPVTGASFFGVQMGATVNIGTPSNGSVTNVHVDASAAIAGSKIDPDFGSQNIVTTGNVGIGTASPSYIADIQADGGGAAERLRLFNTGSATNDDVILQLETGATNNECLIWFGDSADNNVGQIRYDHGADSMEFYANAAERMRIDSSGNVGIGTSSPQQNLQINDSVTPAIRFSRDTSYYWDIGHTNSDFQFNSESGGTIMHLNFNGNVGIGTTSPAGKLHVKSSDASTLVLERDGTGDQISAIVMKDGSGDSTRISSTAGEQVFGVNGSSEAMRIDSSGRVGIGTTLPQAPLVVSNGGGEGVEVGWSAGTSSNYVQSYNRSTSAFTQLDLIGTPLLFKNGATEAARIDSSGRLLVGTTTQVVSGSPSSSVHLVDGGGGKIYMMRDDSGSTVAGNDLGMIRFYSNDGGVQESARIEAEADLDHGADDKPGRLVFSTTADGASSPTERMRIKSDGNVEITDGNLIIGTNGHGINFGASQGSGATSDLLDDYEEGTFTPIYKGGTSAGTFTYNTQIGVYTKIGNRVFVDIGIGTTSRSGGSGHFKIAGLPFPINNSTGAGGGSPALNNIDLNGTESCCNLSVEFHNGQSEIYTLQTFDNGGWANIQITSVPTSSSTNYRVSFAYSTNS